MPPGDTIIYNGVDELPDSIRTVLEKTGLLDQLTDEGKPHYPLPEWLMLLLLSVFIALLFAYGTRLQEWIKRKWKQGVVRGKLEHNKLVYDNWLSMHNGYYKSLQAEARERFLKRTIEFMLAKEFRYHSIQAEEKMPLLISGAAVQLTFGLKNFIMENFPVINVIKREYKIPHHEEVFEGHVGGHSINISWNNFMAGYDDYTNSENLGLHEMAHAISFDVFFGDGENQSHSLKQRLQWYVDEAKPVFKEVCQGKQHTLDDYAATNFEEFWAVAVETFFENPVEFREKMPDLYEAVCELLNQDPLRPEKIIDKRLAGLAD